MSKMIALAFVALSLTTTIATAQTRDKNQDAGYQSCTTDEGYGRRTPCDVGRRRLTPSQVCWRTRGSAVRFCFRYPVADTGSSTNHPELGVRCATPRGMAPLCENRTSDRNCPARRASRARADTRRYREIAHRAIDHRPAVIEPLRALLSVRAACKIACVRPWHNPSSHPPVRATRRLAGAIEGFAWTKDSAQALRIPQSDRGNSINA